MQKRSHGRYRIWFPVQVSAGELDRALAVSQNVSAGGMLVALSARLEVGASIRVTFRLPGESQAQERTLQGRICRIEDNQDDPEGMWPYRVGVEFDHLASELVPHFEAVVNRISRLS